MQAVNFQCGHCGNLMGVGADLLGKQVRCPHCRQVVVAPPPPPPTTAPPQVEQPPAPVVAAPQEAASESLLAPVEGLSDDLFGSVASQPQVEMPTEAAWPNLQLEGVAAPGPSASEPPAEGMSGAGGDGAAAFNEAPPESPAEEGVDGVAGETVAQPGQDWHGGAEGEGSEPPASPEPAVRRQAEGSGMGLMLLLVFLIPYSIFATAAAVWFYYQKQAVKHPLEYLPDWPGDSPGAKREPNKGVSFRYERIKPDVELPARLRVALHQAIQVGDLQVIPEKVEKRKIEFCARGGNRRPELSTKPALVLTLRLRNTSADDYFVPADPAFDARWKGGPEKLKPYTFLEVGSKRFYGGPIPWEPKHDTGGWREEDPREYIRGQEDNDKVLPPQHEMTTIVCTDPDDDMVLSALQNYQGPLLWRVRLRRGLVKVGDREVSASCVIGVEFKAQDIEAR